MRASGIFFCIRIGDFASSLSPSAEGAGTIMRFSGVRIAFFFFAVGDSQKQKGLCLLQSAAALEACRALGKALAE